MASSAFRNAIVRLPVTGAVGRQPAAGRSTTVTVPGRTPEMVYEPSAPDIALASVGSRTPFALRSTNTVTPACPGSVNAPPAASRTPFPFTSFHTVPLTDPAVAVARLKLARAGATDSAPE